MRPSASQVTLFIAIILILAVPTFSFAAPSITSLSPTSGAVGASVTINGSGFGSTQGSSTVKFNGKVASVTSWSASAIIAVVPSGATTGNVVVTVSGATSNGKSFTVVAAPNITSLSPTSGPVGQSITVAGSGFGSTKGSSTIQFNGTTAVPTSWSSTQIKAPVPAGATSGNVVVHASGVDSNAKSFTVLLTPSITSMDPASGQIGDWITITGSNFGDTQGTSTVKFNGTTATPTNWTDTGIDVPVPSGATTGNVVVTVSGVASAGASFTVIATPTISSLSPSSGAVGALVTINGTNFQPTQGDSTVSFNGTLAVPTTWTATQIKAPVPAGSSSGSVVVTVFGLSSNGPNFTVKPTPLITALSQTIGSVGMAVTIYGANFGSSQGSSTVKFNGTAATASAWSASQITVAVPSGATTGNVVVHTSAVDTNGINFVVSTVTSISVSPQDLSVPVNSVQRFTAKATYANGNTQALAGNGTWSSLDTTIATVDGSGVATTLAQGQTTIQATLGSFSGSTTLTVKEPSFVPVGNLNDGRYGHTAMLLPNGKVLIAGGANVSDLLASAELYDPDTKTFAYTGFLHSTRMFHTATLLQNGKVLVAGGQCGIPGVPGYTRHCSNDELYDPATGTFTQLSSVTSLVFHTATLLNSGKVLLVNESNPQRLFDPATETYVDTGYSVMPRLGHSASLLSDGTVLIAGGTDGTFASPNSASAEIYDPATGSFAPTGSLGTASGAHTSTLLNTGGVLIAGGQSADISTRFARAELYDPNSKTFSPTASLAVPRANHTATLLPDGSALLIGGNSTSNTVATAERFDPVSQIFVGAGSMASVRSGHTATLLNDGTVLVAGGDLPNGTAELYAPPQPPPASVQITPAVDTILIGQTLQFRAFDDLGHQRFDVTWTISDPNLASLSSGGSPMLTALSAGQVTLSANVEGVVGQLLITIIPSYVMVTPGIVSMEVGGSRQFRVIDNLGHMPGGVVWTLSDPDLATITTDNEPTLTATAAGDLTLTATVEGVSAQAQIKIFPIGMLGEGSVLWSTPSLPGFSNLQIAQAVPSSDGPDLYSTQLSSDSTQSMVQALKADGRSLWQRQLRRITANSVPDGFGGIIATEYNTETEPMRVIRLDPQTGEATTLVEAAGVQGANGFTYLSPDDSHPQFAVRPDGSLVIAAMTNNGLPPLIVGNSVVYIPESIDTQPDGTQFSEFSPTGPPIVDSDGAVYMEYEVRQIAYPSRITSAVLYLLKIPMSGPRSDTILSSTTEDMNLMPGRIIPDGQGGVLATWTEAPSHLPDPLVPTPFFKGVRVVSGAVGTPFDLPFTPRQWSTAKQPEMVLGENGTVFASGTSVSTDNPNEDISQIVAFDINSGTPRWSHQNSGVVSMLAATQEGGIAINAPLVGVFEFDGQGNSQIVANALSDTPQYSWANAWSARSEAGVAGLALPIAVDPASPWANPRGSASRNGVAVPLCPCLEQVNETTEQALASAPAMSIAGTSNAASDPPLIYVQLIGDPGLNTTDCDPQHLEHCHDTGTRWSLTAETEADSLTGSGLAVVIPFRVSSVQDFNAGLTTSGLITGGVTYIGHGAQQPQADGTFLSILAPGESSGANTNISALNVSTLSGAQLGPNAAITLKTCNAGLRPIKGNTHSIAQLLADQLNRGVYAWKVGMFLSHNLNAKSPNGMPSENKPMYLLPIGGRNVAPCAFIPNQPEPQNCGGGQ